MKLKVMAWCVLIGLAGCTSYDPALVGKWQGERSATPECQYIAWTTIMKPNGNFGTVFFQDAARLNPIRKRGGYWVSRKDLVLFDAIGAKKYNTYRYQVIDADTVQFTTMTPQDATGCRLNVYTDHRVRG